MPGELTPKYPTMRDVDPHLDLISDCLSRAEHYVKSMQRFHWFMCAIVSYQLASVSYFYLANHVHIDQRRKWSWTCDLLFGLAVVFNAMYLFDLFDRSKPPFHGTDILYFSALWTTWHLSLRLQSIACSPGYGYPLTMYAHDRPECGHRSSCDAQKPTMPHWEEPSSKKRRNDMWIMYIESDQGIAEGWWNRWG